MAPTLSLIAKSTPAPFGPLALAYALGDVTVNFVHSLPDKEVVSLEAGGETVVGSGNVLQKLGHLSAGEGIFGSDANDSAQINALILSLPTPPFTFPSATGLLASLEQRLTLRTFLVGHSVTLADWAVWGHLKANTIALAQLSKCPHASRWFAHLSLQPAAAKAVEDMAVQAKIKPVKEKAPKAEEAKGNATFDLGLPHAIEGQVVTRLPPEPSGYLHIGHAKAAILNQYFARMYKGKFLVRFDDTNPSKEKAEFEQSIIEDLAMLGVKPDAQTYTSDYFDQLHIYCVRMIKEGNAYADDTAQEEMREFRMEGIPSKRRDASVEDSLAHFAEMASGTDEGKRWCIRAKISVDDPNKAMRDPVIYRCNDLPHHRTGNKYKTYPTYDFCCPIVDSLEGVTHALRTNEYRDRNPQYQWMLDSLKLRKVHVWDFGRVNFVYTLLSKRKLKDFVEKGAVTGWDDPRFPTVRGIRRRGMTIEALNEYMLLQGPSQAFTNLEWDVIWNLNKKVIDPVAPRFVATEKAGLVRVSVSGPGTPAAAELRELPRHKKNAEVGTKTTAFADTFFVEQVDAASFAQDEEVTFMDWGNAFVRGITKGASGEVEALAVELHLEGDFKKTKKKVTWLAEAPGAKLTPVVLKDYDYLITKKKLEEDDELKNFLTPVTEFKVEAVADHNVAGLAKGAIIQFERKGYYIVDVAAAAGQAAELIAIPDGKAASIALKFQAAEKDAGPAGGAKAAKTVEARKAHGKGLKSKEPGAGQPAGVRGIPEVAPVEAVETEVLSDGTSGFPIKVKTKMYKVDPLIGDNVQPTTKTSMYEVPSLF